MLPLLLVLVAAAGCSRLEPSNTLPGAVDEGSRETRRAVTFKTIFTFAGTNGAEPYGTPIVLNGKLYGTTEQGGPYDDGVLFDLTPSGNEKVLHDFHGDGSAPRASLLAAGGVLYGTASSGGAHQAGSIFAVATSGRELWTYSFKGGYDGAQPEAGLVESNGALYGTASLGGNDIDNDGAFYKATTAGKERVQYAFQGSPDGASPQGT